MTDERRFRRGDIILVALPEVTHPAQQKVRPAVIVQNDVGNRFSPNLIVAAISSQLPTRKYPTNLIVHQGAPESDGTGLDRDSVVQTEVIVTIPKAHVLRHLGSFDATAMQAINECLRVSLALP